RAPRVEQCALGRDVAGQEDVEAVPGDEQEVGLFEAEACTHARAEPPSLALGGGRRVSTNGWRRQMTGKGDRSVRAHPIRGVDIDAEDVLQPAVSGELGQHEGVAVEPD